MNRIKALIFDYNGTLVDDLKYHIDAYLQVFKELGANYSKEEIVEMLGPPTGEVIRRGIEKCGVIADYRNATAEKIELYKKFIEGRDLLFQGERQVLNKLKEKIKLAIFTASDRSQIIFPEDLLALFDIVIAGAEMRNPKPAPDDLLAIAEKFSVPPRECAYVGDMPVDMKTAKNAKMLAIGIENEICPRKELLISGADIIISSFNELEKAVD